MVSLKQGTFSVTEIRGERVQRSEHLFSPLTFRSIFMHQFVAFLLQSFWSHVPKPWTLIACIGFFEIAAHVQRRLA